MNTSRIMSLFWHKRLPTFSIRLFGIRRDFLSLETSKILDRVKGNLVMMVKKRRDKNWRKRWKNESVTGIQNWFFKCYLKVIYKVNERKIMQRCHNVIVLLSRRTNDIVRSFHHTDLTNKRLREYYLKNRKNVQIY